MQIGVIGAWETADPRGIGQVDINLLLASAGDTTMSTGKDSYLRNEVMFIVASYCNE